MTIEMVLWVCGGVATFGTAVGVIWKGSAFVARYTLRGELRPEIKGLVSTAIKSQMEDVMRQITDIKNGEAECHSTVMKAIMETAEMQRIRDEETQQALENLKNNLETVDGRQQAQNRRIDDLHTLVTKLAIKT